MTNTKMVLLILFQESRFLFLSLLFIFRDACLLGGTYESHKDDIQVDSHISSGIIERIDELVPELEVKKAKVLKGLNVKMSGN